MKLLELQQAFAERVGKLITWCYSNDYQLTIGEAHRPQFTAIEYAKRGLGIKNSLHCDKLAIDLFLFKDGKWLQSFADYVPMAKYWLSLGTHDIKTTWGGHFKKVDCVHFSVEYMGRK